MPLTGMGHIAQFSVIQILLKFYKLLLLTINKQWFRSVIY